MFDSCSVLDGHLAESQPAIVRVDCIARSEKGSVEVCRERLTVHVGV